MRHRRALLAALVSLAFLVTPALGPVGSVSAYTDKVITALLPDAGEAAALGLELKSMDDTSSAANYVTARYIDPSPGSYSITFTVTLKPCSSTDGISLASMTSGCTNCTDPSCQERELSNGDRFPKGPCYSAYRNGYTNFGSLAGETVFAQGDVLVRIESSASRGPTSVQDYDLSKSRHEWFVKQVAAQLDAGYQADMMQLTADAYVATQPTGSDVYLSGQDVAVLEGTVTGPNGGVADAIIEGFYYSASGSGWNYTAKTDASGNFERIMGASDQVARITAKVRHTDASPAWAGTLPITVDVADGQAGVVDTGMSVGVSTDRTVYAAGDTVVISCSVASCDGGLPGASLALNVYGTPATGTSDPAGEYTFAHVLAADISDGVYTISVTASHVDYPDDSDSTTFIVGNIVVLVEQNPVTGKAYLGVAADGTSTLALRLSLPGCTDVRVTMADIGELEGDCLSETGAITLDAAGQAELTYYPPDYLTKEQLNKNVDVHQSGSKTWLAEAPMTFEYKEADGKAGRIDRAVLVCRPPVMMVHGFVGGTATWGKMSTYLRGEKFDTFLGDYSMQNHSIEALSAVLQTHVQQQKTDYANANLKLGKVDAVGHSMGGLISRYYANGLAGYTGDLRKLIMVGTPNHGVSWASKKIGNLASSWYDTHRTPAEQLYSESPFMKALNAGERTGAHLNADVQYGNIYGLPDDWVVSAASAYLNGVNAVLQSDVKHSADIPGVPVVAITEYLATWEQVRDWLTEDIYRPALKGSRAEVCKYWGDVYIVNHDASGSHETKLTSSPTSINSFQSLRTGKDSRAIVHLMIDDRPWGVIFLDPDSEMLLGYYSPQLVEVRLWDGGASFRSGKEGHYSVPVNIDRSTPGEWWKTSPQAVVTGLDTEFSISAGAQVVVHCLDGKLVVATPESHGGSPIVAEGESVTVSGETVSAAPGASRDDFWWSAEDDDFLDTNMGAGVLDQLKGLLDSLVNWIKALIGRF